MILAAGFGTRLGDIGKVMPKALIDVGGRTMLERVAARLVDAGVDRLIINVHHHADAIENHLATHDLGAPAFLSREMHEPLETGGGLWNARALFRRDSPFFLANVDILSEGDLRALYHAHQKKAPLATLAVNARESKRKLLFDEEGLFGRVDLRSDTRIEARPARGRIHSAAFAGLHVVSPSIFDLVTERGVFSILDVYLRLAATGQRTEAFDIGSALWLEIGTPERLEAARRIFIED